ncbi:MAG: hypothetical protein V1908_00410 [Candidatus Peregrinibacteria bacterium]
MLSSPIPPSDIEKNRQMAALSYLWIFSFIVLVARRDSAFVQLHARQGLVLFLLSILLWPWGITRYGELMILALMVFGFLQAATGNAYRIPVIGDFAEGRLNSPVFGKVWHYLRHGIVRLFKPEHVIPEYQKAQPSVIPVVKETSTVPATSVTSQPVSEEKKVSALIHRVDEDEKKLSALEEEVKTLESKLTPIH